MILALNNLFDFADISSIQINYHITVKGQKSLNTRLIYIYIMRKNTRHWIDSQLRRFFAQIRSDYWINSNILWFWFKILLISPCLFQSMVSLTRPTRCAISSYPWKIRKSIIAFMFELLDNIRLKIFYSFWATNFVGARKLCRCDISIKNLYPSASTNSKWSPEQFSKFFLSV